MITDADRDAFLARVKATAPAAAVHINARLAACGDHGVRATAYYSDALDDHEDITVSSEWAAATVAEATDYVIAALPRCRALARKLHVIKTTTRLRREAAELRAKADVLDAEAVRYARHAEAP